MGRLWALSDLHLSGSGDKPMDVFGPAWEDHQGRIAANWDRLVSPADIVLAPGDTSWAMKPDKASVDLAWLAERPGRKVLIKGNHDYWWPKSRTKLTGLLPEGVFGLKKTAVILDGVGFFGVRGGDFAPLRRYGDPRTQEQVDATLAKELGELAASIADLDRLEAEAGPTSFRVCLCHYPPVPPGRRGSRFTELIGAAGAHHCIYGHLHGVESAPERVEGEIDGVRYLCASCDLVDFTPRLIDELPGAPAS